MPFWITKALLIAIICWTQTKQSASAASDIVLDISAEHNLDIGGNWAIPFRHQNQWWLGLGQASDFWVAPIQSSEFGVWEADITHIRQLTNHGNLRDHSFRGCPDGSYLHVSGGTIGSDNIVFRYNALFEPIDEWRYPQGSPPHATNDVQVICGQHFMGFAIAEQQGMRDFFVDISEPPGTHTELSQSPRMTGAGMLEDDERLLTVGIDPGPGLAITSYDQALNVQGRWEIPPAANDIVHYWPSRMMKIGNYYLVAVMGKDPSLEWQFDFGDLYVVILNSGFSVLEWHQISHNDPVNGGGMRPWFDVDTETGQMLLGYDAINTLYLYELTLDIEQLLPSNDEDAEPEPSTEPGSETAKVDGCGGLLMLPILLMIRRKK